MTPTPEPTPAPCDCHKCASARQDDALAKGDVLAWGEDCRMRLCPICGNKRCPKASDHDFDCTGSNAPGQAGSIYASQQEVQP
jgi:hypothetical protein